MEILLWQLHHLIFRVMLFLKVELIAYCYEKDKRWFGHLYLPFPFKKVTCCYCKNVGQLLSDVSVKTCSHHATLFCKWHQCLLFTDFLIHIFIYLYAILHLWTPFFSPRGMYKLGRRWRVKETARLSCCKTSVMSF